ncbi:PASTA domain-containing protein [Nocardioides sp. CN2-186]|uniref:PASTA domain-containing protein n=1 Tax=Nocardioides tweenelious TaxID=3156607 RepID=UPI0032B31AFE
MDPREYLDARWYALLRAADDLGVPEDEAPVLVHQVLEANRRRIRRAEDPDPVVLEALRVAALGPPADSPRARWPWLVAAAAVVAIAVGVAAVVMAPDDEQPADLLRADQVPSLFGYDGTTARAMLDARGLKVKLEPFRACEIQDRVIASDPPTGATYAPGDAITVYTSIPADVSCLSDYGDIEDSWAFVDFLNGRGPAPSFSSEVVVRVGDGSGTSLSGADDLSQWADTGVPAQVRKATDRVALVGEHPLTYAMPVLSVGRGGTDCGRPAAPAAGADALSFTIAAPAGRTSCPLRVDLVRHGDVIDAVTLYPSLS